MQKLLYAALVTVAVACGDFLGTDGDDGPPEAVLRNADDPAAEPSDAKYTAWLLANRGSIASLTSEEMSDLRFLDGAVDGRRVVMLGESHHAVREYNHLKVRMIKYLHERLGYDVIAFEAGTYECWKTDVALDVNENEAIALMTACLHGTWFTEEVQELFEYLKRRRLTSRPLTLVGIDNQMTGDLLTTTVGRHALVLKALSGVAPSDAARLAALDSTWLHYHLSHGSTARLQWTGENAEWLREGYTELATLARAHRAAIDAAVQELPNAALMLGRVAANAKWLLKQMHSPFEVARNVRDSAMAENLMFVVDTLYPQRKVIVWAHNNHIRKRAFHDGFANSVSFGSHVAARKPNDVYVIGFYKYRGQYGHPGNPSTLQPHEAGSLESILYWARRKYLFVDLLGATRSDSTEWMFQPIPSWDNGNVVFRDHYDGIVQIDTVSVPRFADVPRVRTLAGVPY